MYLTTRLLEPNRQAFVDGFDAALRTVLPPDYLGFLRKFGTGTYAGEVNIGYPDQSVIPTTFGDYLDLWVFDDAYNETDLLLSTQLASTANGDILCVASTREGQVFVLPRHSEIVNSYPSFFDAVNALLPAGEVYFDPVFEAAWEQISLVEDARLLDIAALHQAFLVHLRTDFVTNVTTQPRYFFQAFGGWVFFDLVYRNGITVKYQQSLAPLVQPVLELLYQQGARLREPGS